LIASHSLTILGNNARRRATFGTNETKRASWRVREEEKGQTGWRGDESTWVFGL